VSRCATFLVFASLVALAPAAQAQTRTPARPQSGVRLRGFAEFGGRTFTASQSFDAVLGSHTGTLFGGGVEVLVGPHVFVSFGASRFQRDGERVFVSGSEVFPLGIATTVSIRPIEASAGWRFGNPQRSLIPYVGGGIGWHRYQETSDFAQAGDDVEFSKTGYQVLGGVEWRAARWVGIAGEAAWMAVPGAFPDGPTSAAAAFGEDDLGGAVFRVKVVIGTR
jgi:hypothetical protein